MLANAVIVSVPTVTGFWPATTQPPDCATPAAVNAAEVRLCVSGGGGIEVKVATTVQSLVIGLVVKVFPDRVPPHVPPTNALYPPFGATVNTTVLFKLTDCGVDGDMVPFGPADGVTIGGGAVAVNAAVDEATMFLTAAASGDVIAPKLGVTSSAYAAIVLG